MPKERQNLKQRGNSRKIGPTAEQKLGQDTRAAGEEWVDEVAASGSRGLPYQAFLKRDIANWIGGR